MKNPPTPLPAPFTRAVAIIGLATPCNGFCNALREESQTRPLVLALANHAEQTEIEVIALPNELALDEQGWALIPYGSSLHSGKDAFASGSAAEKAGVIQRFTREDAVALVNDFKSTWSTIKRAVVGLPIFKGHPDAPRFAARYPDKAPRGSIADLEVRDNGLALKPILTPQGGADVAAGASQFSPFWLLKKTGEEGGRIVAAPFKLLSIGLVERGNVPGLSLINEDPENSPLMKTQLLALLKLLGQAPAADASDEQIVAACNAAEPILSAALTAQSRLATVETDLAALAKTKGELEAEKLALANSVETATGRATTAETALKQERTARAALVVTQAIATGRITPAQREATVLSLVNAADFAAEEARLQALKPALKTGVYTASLSKERSAEGDASTTVLSLVNERMEKHDEDYSTAYLAVQTDPKHAALFSGMKQPAKK